MPVMTTLETPVINLPTESNHETTTRPSTGLSPPNSSAADAALDPNTRTANTDPAGRLPVPGQQPPLNQLEHAATSPQPPHEQLIDPALVEQQLQQQQQRQRRPSFTDRIGAKIKALGSDYRLAR